MRRNFLVVLVLCGLVSSASVHADPFSQAKDSDPILSRLEFQIFPPNSEEPLPSFQYAYRILTPDTLAKPFEQKDRECQSKDGILRIPEPFPDEGRIQLWINAKDSKNKELYASESFGYHITKKKPIGPARIVLKPRSLPRTITVTGKVTSKVTGKPVAGAKISLQMSNIGNMWYQPEGSATTNKQGRFRLVYKEEFPTFGIVVSHPDYARTKESFLSINLEDENEGCGSRKNGSKNKSSDDEDQINMNVQLVPIKKLSGRLVDTDGRPIVGATPAYRVKDVFNRSVAFKSGKSDNDGKFWFTTTKDELENTKEPFEVEFCVDEFKPKRVPLTIFLQKKEPVITLERRPVAQGRILDSDGKPLEKCEVRFGKHDDRDWGYQPKIPHHEGEWKTPIREEDKQFLLKVFVDGKLRLLKQYDRDEILKGPITERLPATHAISGKLDSRVKFDKKHSPAVALIDTKYDELRDQVDVQPDGSFRFDPVFDGEYLVLLMPAQRTTQGNFGGGTEKIGWKHYLEKSHLIWKKNVTVEGGDLKLDPIDAHKINLLPGTVKGVVYDPQSEGKPLASAFGYLCLNNRVNSVHGNPFGDDYEYLLKFMTDSKGRFEIKNCPAGKYYMLFTTKPTGNAQGDPGVWVHVTSEKTTQLKIFEPDKPKCQETVLTGK